MEISITRALAEVKLIEKKINENKTVMFDIKLNNKLQNQSWLSPGDFVNNTKGEMDSLRDLYTRRRNIKDAIAKANIENTITINKETFTILSAIDYKNSIVGYVQALERYLSQYLKCKRTLDNRKEEIEEKVDEQVNSSMGSNNQSSKNIVENMLKQYEEMYLGEIVQGVEVSIIEKEIEKVNEILAEMDMCLSEVNASTKIKID